MNIFLHVLILATSAVEMMWHWLTKSSWGPCHRPTKRLRWPRRRLKRPRRLRRRSRPPRRRVCYGRIDIKDWHPWKHGCIKKLTNNFASLLILAKRNLADFQRSSCPLQDRISCRKNSLHSLSRERGIVANLKTKIELQKARFFAVAVNLFRRVNRDCFGRVEAVNLFGRESIDCSSGGIISECIGGGQNWKRWFVLPLKALVVWVEGRSSHHFGRRQCARQNQWILIFLTGWNQWICLAGKHRLFQRGRKYSVHRFEVQAAVDDAKQTIGGRKQTKRKVKDGWARCVLSPSVLFLFFSSTINGGDDATTSQSSQPITISMNHTQQGLAAVSCSCRGPPWPPPDHNQPLQISTLYHHNTLCIKVWISLFCAGVTATIEEVVGGV